MCIKYITYICIYNTFNGSITHPLQASVRNAIPWASGKDPRDIDGKAPPPLRTTQQLMLAVRNWLIVVYIVVGVANPPTPSVNKIRPNNVVYNTHYYNVQYRYIQYTIYIIIYTLLYT